MEKMTGESLDLTQENIKRLKELFPEVLTEKKIDFYKLRLILGDEVETSPERYEFRWNGKNEAIKLSQTPSMGTLRPDKESSKNWDTTDNLYIEGDNLEVLKLLQKSYFGKIKMIYIDPPYNTGKDFVYKDNFHDNIANYKEITNQSTKANPETSGRFHTDWLNMMYPRLKLARNLLKEDGVVFISIDEKEINNLTKLCDEIFGGANHLETFHVQVRFTNKSLNEDNDFQPVMEYVLIYAKNRQLFKPNKPAQPYDLSKFIYSIEELSEGSTIEVGNKKVTIFKSGEWNITKHQEGRIGLLKETWASGSLVKQSGTAAEFLSKYLIDRKPIDGLGVLYKIHNMGEDGLGYRYVSGPQKADAIRGKFYSGVPLERIEEINSGISLKYRPIVNYYDYSGDFGNIRHEGGVSFNSGKKPIKMLQHLMFTANLESDDIVMDFFSGSASFAHAVMEFNQLNKMNINHIMVQLPEVCDEQDDMFKAGFENICDIGKERIRRAGQQIIQEAEDKNLDIGFKVFKLDDSNIKAWDPNTKDLENTLFNSVQNLKEDRTQEDLLYELMLKMGIELTAKIEEIKVDGKIIYNIQSGGLVICLENEITKAMIDYIPTLKSPFMDMKVVFKEYGFKSDADKMNTIQNLKQHGIKDVRSV